MSEVGEALKKRRQRRTKSAPPAGRLGGDSPPREEIERRAYEIYLGRGGEPGRELEDWIQAERELRDKYAKFARN